jgi:Ca2+/Na+ antiporter
VAGITILAFGNGSPDVFSTVAAIQQGKFDIALNELTGSGCFVTMVVVGAVVRSRARAHCRSKHLHTPHLLVIDSL